MGEMNRLPCSERKKRIMKTWTVDQIAKSEFFHQKLHEWGLLEIADDIEKIKGEEFEWDLEKLNISQEAWNKVIHRGIKPVRVFSHPKVLVSNPRRISYYRMLAMVSQKSMSRVGLPVKDYENCRKNIDEDMALKISRHLNNIISKLIESDEEMDAREIDLWRGMAAGTQAQGSWQNAKGDRAEVVVKGLVEKRVYDKGLVSTKIPYGVGDKEKLSEELVLKDGRRIIMKKDPDIEIRSKDGKIQVAVEIKGGIDTAGVHERRGAALKTLGRAKRESPNCVTVLIMRAVSLTSEAKKEIIESKTIDYFFSFEDIVEDKNVRKQFFEILKI